MAEHDLISDFAVEAREHLQHIEEAFLALARAELPDAEQLNRVFRAIHSIKGCAGFVGCRRIGELAHSMETVLSLMKKGELRMDERLLDPMLAGVDRLNRMVADIAHSNEQEVGDLCAQLDAALRADAAPETQRKLDAPRVLQDAAGRALPFDITEFALNAIPPAHRFLYALRLDLDAIARTTGQTPLAVVRGLQKVGDVLDARLRTEYADITQGMPTEPLLFDVLFSCAVEPDWLHLAFQIPPENIARVERPRAADAGIPPALRMRFAADAESALAAAEQALLAAAGGNAAALSEAFRALHNFKGGCGFVAAADLERIAHAAESLLDAARQGQLAPTPADYQVLLKIVDVLRGGARDVGAGGPGAVPGRAGICDFLREILEKSVRHPAPPETLSGPPPAAPPSAANGMPARQDIRVDVGKLDALVNLVGELVIAQEMVVGDPEIRRIRNHRLRRAIHNLARISAELQDISMAVRMIPLSATFRKLNRLVHDVALKAGKQARLELDGEDTEVDKNVIELISDPLVHIVRNALDHGIEPPDERRAAGKPEVGTVAITARHEGGEVWITIADDGRGLDRERILRQAVARGLLHGDGAALTDEQTFQFIFEPGFSTAEKVTDISGRGVGMDVVKRNMEKLKGRVEIHSVAGAGATIRLRIPLTLAIIDGMLLGVGETRYTLPTLAIRETLRPRPEQILVTPDGAEIVRVREELIPVIRLHRLFRRRSRTEDLTAGILLIVESAGATAALFVDEILGQRQTVIKGLSGYLGRVRGLAGCTILGTGEVSLILDVGGLLEWARGGAANPDWAAAPAAG